MTALSWISIALGSAIIIVRLPLLATPAEARHVLSAFPRHAWAGRFLTAVDLAWVTWLLFQANLGWFEPYKQSLYLIAPVVWFMTIYFVDELLAPRALGGLLLLIPAPILDAARWHPSPARYLMIVIAYIMVVVGAVWVVSPHRFRRMINFALQDSDPLTRLHGGFGLVFGSILVLMGWLVY